MGIAEVVEKGAKFIKRLDDESRYGIALIYFGDAEKYKLIGDIKVYNYFKKLIQQEYTKVTAPEVVAKFESSFKGYVKKSTDKPK